MLFSFFYVLFEKELVATKNKMILHAVAECFMLVSDPNAPMCEKDALLLFDQ